MAGWLKKKRMGENIQKLWEDTSAYGAGFHNKLFNEEVEKKEKEDDELEECGEIDRISQLVSPEGGGKIEDEDDDDDEEEGEITIKIEKEEDGEEDEEGEEEEEDDKEDEGEEEEKEVDEEDDEDEELNEGAILDKLATIIQSLFKTDAQRAKELARSMDRKAAQDFIDKFGGTNIVGTGTVSPAKQVGSAKQLDRALSMGEEDEGCKKEMDEAVQGENEINKLLRTNVFEDPTAPIQLIGLGLSALVEGGKVTAEGASKLLKTLVAKVGGGESEQLKQMRQAAKERGNPLADETEEDKMVESEDEEKKDDEELEEAFDNSAIASTFKSLLKNANLQMLRSTAAGGKAVTGGKTGIGQTASKAKRRAEKTLALAGEENEKMDKEDEKEEE